MRSKREKGNCAAKCSSPHTSQNGVSLRWFRFFFRLLLFALFLFFEQRFLFLFVSWAVSDVALTVEVHVAIDQGFLGHGVIAQRIAVVDDQIGVFARFD